MPGSVEVPAAWPWDRNPRLLLAFDAVLVALAFSVGVAGHVAARGDDAIEAAPAGPMAIVMAGLAASVLLWRRARPLWMLGALMAVSVIAAGALGDPALFSVQIATELVVLFYCAGSWSTRVRSAIAVTIAITFVVGGAALADDASILSATSLTVALIAFPFVAGYVARAHRDDLARQFRSAESEREERARRAVETERARIARELHDVVAHHVSLIGVQAGAARLTAVGDPEASTAALSAIEQSSREAVAEMHRLLDVLSPLDNGSARRPQPDLTSLPQLLERWRDAGIEIEAQLASLDRPLPAPLSLCVYRIIEESLTNVARHSRARRASLRIAVDDAAVVVSVVDPGPSVTAVGPPGRGLLGMRERVALYDGELRAQPTPDGGFAVNVRIPWRAP